MPSTLFLKEEAISGDSSDTFSANVRIPSLNRDGSRSAFTPYKPTTTVLTNLQRGNIQTETPAVLSERSIHQLAAQGELFLQNEDFEPDMKDDDGMTPLMWAASYGQLDTVRKLISCGASVSAISNNGENALILASVAGHAAIVKELLSHGTILDYQDKDGNTAIMYAAYNNHAGCIQELLNAGADLTKTNEVLESAFDIAIKRRSKHAQAIMEKHMLSILQSNINK